jgi:hypothetical protein
VFRRQLGCSCGNDDDEGSEHDDQPPHALNVRLD